MAGFTIGRKDLYEEIWSTSVMKTAEKYDISYTRLVSACRKYNIPTPPPGYSTKLEFGKKVTRTPLPDAEEDTVVIEAPAETKKEKREKKPSVAVEDITADSPTSEDDNDQDKFPLMHYGDSLQKQREELYQKVWEKPISEAAKEEHIADATLRNRCRKLEVPIPDRGYWAKLKAGKPVYKKELHKMTLPDFPKPHTGTKRKLHIETNALSFMQAAGRLEILKLASVLRVGGPGSAMTDDIQKLYTAFRESHKPVQELYLPGIIPRRRDPEPAFLTGEVSTKTANRAFHIIDALTRALLPYGGSFTCTSEGIYQDNKYTKKYRYWFYVNGERVFFTISEGKGQIVHEITWDEQMATLKYKEAQRRGNYASEPQIPKYDQIWNGKLKMTIAGKTTFEDCKSYMLEDRIGEILIALYEAFYPERINTLKELEQIKKELEEYEKKEEEDQKKQQSAERYNEEIIKTKALMNKVADYETACRIRKYIDAVRSNPDSPDNNPEWLEWASGKADWYDPSIAKEDDFFGKRQHELDPEKKALVKQW